MNTPPVENFVGAFRPCLERLDILLDRAINAARSAHPSPAENPYPGLCVSDDEVTRLLVREPLRPSLWFGSEAEVSRPGMSAAASFLPKELLDLSDFELDVILLALAPELDLKYERLYAYLNDDLTKKWPTPDLVLNVLCASSTERLIRYRYLLDDARLFAWGVLQTERGDHLPLARRLRLDPIVLRRFLAADDLDERLKKFCTLLNPSWSLAEVPIPPELTGSLYPALAIGWSLNTVRVHLRGPEGCGQMECAEGLAAALAARLLIADFSGIPEQDHQQLVSLVLLQARLFGQLPYLKGIAWNLDGRTRELLSSYPGMVLFEGVSGLEVASAFEVTLDFALPTYAQRKVYWTRLLRAADAATVSPDELASVFELSFAQMRDIVAAAGRATRVAGRAQTTADFMAHARQHSSRDLAAKAERIEPRRRWPDLILHADAMAQLRELCDRIRRRHRVLEVWGFGGERRGIGVNALFVGTSGTGKTLAAEVIAADLELNLYRIDLAAVVSKYVGETEKNLESIFRSAEQSNAVLLFDEADALFGKRSAVRDAHDRYANIEIAYLLQRLEVYPGVAILTTNLSDNLDQSFTRRLAYTVHFPFPGPLERQRIWETVWPPHAPLASDFQPQWLAERFKLSGGNIRNVALAAACLVDDDTGVITMTHILHAIRREYQKMGKALVNSEQGRVTTDLQAVAS
jgi:ATPase family associated with various cellular activities (AAA)